MDMGNPLLKMTSAALGAIAAAVLSVPLAQADDTLRVMTQNLFQGTNFTELLAATTPSEFVQAVTVTYQNVLATQPAERMKAVAREIARSGPDIVGLQEAAILRTGAAAPATAVAVDMLAILLQELANLGHPYVAAAILPGLDAEAPS